MLLAVCIDQHAFIDLEFEGSRRHRMRQKTGFDGSGEIVPSDLNSRHVDGDCDWREIPAAPLRNLAADLSDHPGSDRNDEFARFGYWNELAGKNLAVTRMIEADERFESGK